MTTIRYTYDPANPSELTADQRARLETMNDAQIEANAVSDHDNPPLTDIEIATAYRPEKIRALRRRLGLSQNAFTQKFGINLRTLQEWEQGRRAPDQIARSYLRVISQVPDTVIRALADA